MIFEYGDSCPLGNCNYWLIIDEKNRAICLNCSWKEEFEPNKCCQGYKEETINGIEYGCKYEFSGEIFCDECIFGRRSGTKDPRINSKKCVKG